jgi:sec-independent protein translocase protein TatA
VDEFPSKEHTVFGLGAQELIVVLLIALVLFGGAKIPELGRSHGQATREFKKDTDEPEAKPSAKEGEPKGGRS